MVRQINIRVVDEEQRKHVIDVLRDPGKGGISPHGPNCSEQITEIEAVGMFLIQIICPSHRIGILMHLLGSMGCGSKFGVVTVCTLDCMQV